jgi:hypothetical protein
MFQSLVSTSQPIDAMPSSFAILTARGVHMPPGWRKCLTVAPGAAARMASSVFCMSERTMSSDFVPSLVSCFHVWLHSAWPSATMSRTSCGNCST